MIDLLEQALKWEGGGGLAVVEFVARYVRHGLYHCLSIFAFLIFFTILVGFQGLQFLITKI